jgi:hypothetical protein
LFEEYGISVTTLEEVFLKVAEGIDAIKPELQPKMIKQNGES